MTTTTSRLRVLAALAAAAGLGLAGCSGDGEGPASSEPAATAAMEAAPADTTGETSPEAATEGETAADTATSATEQWRTAGTVVGVTGDRTQFLVTDNASGSTALYDTSSTSATPTWTGTCESAVLLGYFVVCDAQLIDPATGDATPFPAGSARPVGWDADHVAMVNDDGSVAGYDTGLTELYRIEGSSLPDAEVGNLGRVFVLVRPGGDPTAMPDFNYYDTATGTLLSEGGMVYGLDDGYVVWPDGLGDSIGYSWDGTEQWQRSQSAGVSLVQPEFQVAPTLDDFNPTGAAQAVAEEAATSANPAQPIWLGGEVVLFQLNEDDTFSVGDQLYNGAPLGAVGWQDGAYVIATNWAPMEGTPSTSVYEVGTPDPLVTLDGGVMLERDGHIVTGDGNETIVYEFAG